MFHVPVKVLMLSMVLIEQLSIAKELSQVPTLDGSNVMATASRKTQNND